MDCQIRLLLDTEFTDENLLHAELVSLAFVSEDVRAELHLERDPLPERCSRFVHENVYPLLDRGEAAIPDVEFTRRLRAFLRETSDPLIVCDYPGDKFLAEVALIGFRLPRSALANSDPIPAIRWNIVDDAELVARIER